MAFKKGDRVLLNMRGPADAEGDHNWAQEEIRKTGVNWLEPQVVENADGWLNLVGCRFGHPEEKFLKLEEV